MPQLRNTDWMTALAAHWQTMSNRYPDQQLLIAFDIDGTLIDTRFTILHLLQRYDQHHCTRFFKNIAVKDITHHENQMQLQLKQWQLDSSTIDQVCDFFYQHRWQEDVLISSETSYPSALELISLLNESKNTHIALITGRCNSLRQSTLKAINHIAHPSGLHFDSEQLLMNHNDWKEVALGKKTALQQLQQQNYKVIAMVDNEPDNLNILVDIDKDLLLLHADTIYQSTETLHPSCISGIHYCIDQLSEVIAAAA